MRLIRTLSSRIALAAILVLLAACKGDTPTAPAPGGGTGGAGGGGTTPPTGVTLTLTASNADPLVDSNVVVTATVTQNGQPVPNGTAVEFVTSGGLIDGASGATIKTTTNGVATVVLTSTSAGKIDVQATVNNVSRTTSVTFRDKPIVQPPPVTNPTITSVTPPVGRPAGGEVIRITGTNFKGPVRVLVDRNDGLPVEAFVSNATETSIEFVTPPVNLGSGQQLVTDVIVITSAGTASEQRVEATGAFTYRNEKLTPVVNTISPASGPIGGGTQVTIFGEGFQAPVQVFFGVQEVPSWTEAQVISVKFNEIVVITPAGSETTPGGAGAVTGPVDVRVLNIASGTEDVVDNLFRYVTAMTITAVGPGEGIYLGGTRITIDGTGFVPPVTVSVAGFPAQPISVTGTKIVAETSGIVLSACGDVAGPVTVTNVVNGDNATGPNFIYRVPKPAISAIQSPVTAGGTTTVTVLNAFPGVTRFTLGTRQIFPSGSVYNNNGTATYTLAVPSNYTFGTEACTVNGVAGTRRAPAVVDVTYTNVETTCSNTLAQGLEIRPSDNTCTVPQQNITVSPAGSCPAGAPMPTVAPAANSTRTLLVTNSGGQPLQITGFQVLQSSNAAVSVSPATATVAGGSAQTFTVTATPVAAGNFTATIEIQSNDPDTPLTNFCIAGTAVTP